MLADSLIRKADNLKSQRSGYEDVWRDVASFVLPSSPMSILQNSYFMSGDRVMAPNSQGVVEDIFDTTGLIGVRRLSSAIESLSMPQNQRWHELEIDDWFGAKTPHNSAQFLERLRDYQFRVRYAPQNGFVTANQAALRQCTSLGTGLVLVKENRKGGSRNPYTYENIPLWEALLDVDNESVLDTFIRRYGPTARQLYKRYGDKVSRQVKSAIQNEDGKDKVIEIIHAIVPREEIGSRRLGVNVRNSDYASYVIEVEAKHIIEESGYYEFPLIDYVWDREPRTPYGISPVMLLMADIKSANVMGQTALVAGQNSVQPPMATVSDGVGGGAPLDLSPLAVNPGYLDEHGRMLVQPIHTAQNPSWLEKLIVQKQEAIKEGLYLSLFNILVQNSQMTATEALIRADEKGQILGPIGSNLQTGLSRLIDREIAILGRSGAFDEGSPLEPPAELIGQEIGPKYTSPLDRLQRSYEVLGIQRTLEILLPLAERKPELMLNFDFNEIVRIVAEVNGAPMKIMVSEEERDARLAEMQQVQQAQQAAQLVEQGASAVSGAAGAATATAEAAQNGMPLLQQLSQLVGGGNEQEEAASEAV